jgi:4-hydroxybenzoyl-CoA reductase subunit beta
MGFFYHGISMMRLPRFTLFYPRTVKEAARAMSDHGPEAMVLAGGTDVLPKMKRRQFTPKFLVSLRKLKALKELRGSASSGLRLGSMATLTQIREHSEVHPVVRKTMALISTPVLQNMGTIGGNLLVDTRCTYYDQNYGWRKSINFCMKKDGKICWVAPSSPRCWAISSSDSAPVMIALGARVRLEGPQGEREIPVSDLYNDDGIEYVKKKPDEILTDVILPPVDGWKAAYWKLRRRGSFDFPVLGVAAWVRFGAGRVVEDARIALAAVQSYPVEVVDAARELIGRPLGAKEIAAAAERCFSRGKPLDNSDFAMNWRKEMIRRYVTGALTELVRA